MTLFTSRPFSSFLLIGAHLKSSCVRVFPIFELTNGSKGRETRTLDVAVQQRKFPISLTIELLRSMARYPASHQSVTVKSCPTVLISSMNWESWWRNIRHGSGLRNLKGCPWFIFPFCWKAGEGFFHYVGLGQESDVKSIRKAEMRLAPKSTPLPVSATRRLGETGSEVKLGNEFHHHQASPKKNANGFLVAHAFSIASPIYFEFFLIPSACSSWKPQEALVDLQEKRIFSQPPSSWRFVSLLFSSSSSFFFLF